MTGHSAQNSADPNDETLAPDYLAHWMVKTARSKEMITWYHTVFGAHIVHEDSKLAFLTWDEESHRLGSASRRRSSVVHVPVLCAYPAATAPPRWLITIGRGSVVPAPTPTPTERMTIM